MRKVERDELLDYVTYSEKRPQILEKILKEKRDRRIHLGDILTFLFESTETAKYQIQEMMRIEKIVKEETILHEIKTYNDLLGEKGELGCTLLIEIEDPSEREKKLKELLNLPQHIYLRLEDGTKSYCTYNKEQVGEDKLSSVQFLKFKCSSPPQFIGCDHPLLTQEVELSELQKETLKNDLQ